MPHHSISSYQVACFYYVRAKHVSKAVHGDSLIDSWLCLSTVLLEDSV